MPRRLRASLLPPSWVVTAKPLALRCSIQSWQQLHDGPVQTSMGVGSAALTHTEVASGVSSSAVVSLRRTRSSGSFIDVLLWARVAESLCAAWPAAFAAIYKPRESRIAIAAAP